MARQQLNRKQTIGLAIAFAIIGLVMVIPGLMILLDSLASKEWPTVEGTVLSSALETNTTGNRSSFKPKIVYCYTVQGKNYTRNRPTLDDGVSNKTTGPMAAVGRYKANQKVQVYYNPTNPQVSVLEPGATINSYLLLIGGLAFLGFGLLIFALRGYVPA